MLVIYGQTGYDSDLVTIGIQLCRYQSVESLSQRLVFAGNDLDIADRLEWNKLSPDASHVRRSFTRCSCGRLAPSSSTSRQT